MGFFDSIINFFTARSTNRQNAKQNAKDRNFQREMWNKQSSWAEKMYQKTFSDQQRVNDPAYEMQRRRNAGLNPYLSDSSSAAPASVPSAPSPPSASSHQFNAPHSQGMTDELMGALQFRLANKKNEADIDTQKALANLYNMQAESFMLDNSWKDQLNSQKFQETVKRMRAMDLAYDTSNFNLSHSMKMEPYQLQVLQNTVRGQEIDNLKADLEKQMLEKSLPYVIPTKRAELASILQSIRESKARQKLYKAQRKTEGWKLEVSKEESFSKRIDNLLRGYSDDEIKRIKSAAVRGFELAPYKGLSNTSIGTKFGENAYDFLFGN